MGEQYDGRWYNTKHREEIVSQLNAILKDGVTEADIFMRAHRRVKEYEAVKGSLKGGIHHWPSVDIAVKQERDFVLFAYGIESGCDNTEDISPMFGIAALLAITYFPLVLLLLYSTLKGEDGLFAMIAAVCLFFWILSRAVTGRIQGHAFEKWKSGVLYGSEIKKIMDTYDKTIENARG